MSWCCHYHAPSGELPAAFHMHGQVTRACGDKVSQPQAAFSDPRSQSQGLRYLELQACAHTTDASTIPSICVKRPRLLPVPAGSVKGRQILEDWQSSLQRFWQLVPPSEASTPEVGPGFLKQK